MFSPARLLAALVCLIPTLAFAAGAEANVKLAFSDQDKMFLYVSLVLALLAIGVGFAIRGWVLKQSMGSEKMQEVSAAIKDGALAYLRQQFRTMGIFVVLLAIGLFFLYNRQFEGIAIYGVPIGLWLSVAFILGVLASYTAGYIGMVMAVASNMRVAAAAQTSYKNSLEIGFRAGAVAGLVTVGMGLLGATIIFLVAGEQAMKLLIGFGFGGSLAALFMRVGGGIYTKAADVGADLVGKVEAGIPEDDPRNAATIADNVGDNVGDCAGMAADVFESYEVTLVAAIVLGAATASIFDQPTWMKLIIFALMARGVGIIASVLGIAMVKGKNDEKMDPLTPISRGFWASAIFAAIGTALLAFFIMQGVESTTYSNGKGEQVSGLRRIAMRDLNAMYALNSVEQGITAPGAAKPAKPPAAMKDAELLTKTNAFLSKLHEEMGKSRPASMPKLPAFKPLTEDELAQDKDDPVRNYTVLFDGVPRVLLVDYIGPGAGEKIYVAQTTFTPPAVSGTTPKPVEQWTIMPETSLKSPGQGTKIENQAEIMLAVSSVSGDLYWTIGKDKNGKAVTDKKALAVLPPLDFTEAKHVVDPAAMTSPDRVEPDGKIATVSQSGAPVEWWRFALAVIVGILMAFVIERLTDNFVSFEKKPVREIAQASTAGPAPMIIQGFAYGMESAVWSVLAIVIALLAPLFIFPPSMFGGFILSFYGIALVGLGLLTTTAYILAMDTFGPISDNAQGVYQMSGAEENEVVTPGSMPGSRAVQRLDAAGNTTKALTKGFAIATAVVAAVALFHSFIEDSRLTELGLRLEVPQIFIGLLIGGAAPFLFSAFSINAVGRASFQLIGEVRRQFAADPGIMAGTSKPNYARCVAIVTSAAQKELLGPG
ncbi:MAG TPA: sodium/proton-translocating pyrophosphatase, partial [Fimbriimonadales bacterium]|nr:sodium/proton-translocating pyrophosphatase [Fimbriimonadales bacterium]